MPKLSPEISIAGLQLEKNGAAPLYQQLYDQLREMIVAKRLRPGDRLPATRILSKELGVSRTSLIQCFEQLVLEGYLEARTGSGTFVSAQLPDDLMRATTSEPAAVFGVPPAAMAGNPFIGVPGINTSRDETIPFQIGAPALDAFPYKLWFQVSGRVLKNLRQYHLGYENTLGYYPLREQIAAYLRVARGVRCETEQVVVVTGSQQGLNMVISLLLEKGDRVWMEDPGYPAARATLLKEQLKVYSVPVEKDGLDVDYMISQSSNARFGFLTPAHQYPLGATLSLAKRQRLLQWAADNNAWLFEDDYDSEFRYAGHPLPSLQGMDTNGRVIFSGTFSKVLFPGLQLAYLVLPSLEMVGRFKQLKAIVDRQSPIMDQIILSEFMREGHFLRHVRKMRTIYAGRQQMLVDLMNKHLAKEILTTALPAGMSLIGWLSPAINPVRLQQEIKKKQLIVAFLENYSVMHHPPPGIYLGFAAFSKYQLQTAVEKLSQAVISSMTS